MVQAMKKGESFEAAAASAKAKPGVLPNVSRQALQQSRKLDGDMIERLFAAKKGDFVTGQVGQVQFMVARIDAVSPAVSLDAAREAAGGSKGFDQQIFEDMIAETQALAVSVIKPQGDLAAARLALGLTADEAAKSGAKPKRGPAL